MKNKINGFSLVELIISIAIVSMVIAGALFAFQIMQQNTSSGIAISKANEISEHIFESMERDLKQTGIFYSIDTTQEYNSETVNPDHGYDIDNILIEDGLNWTVDICYDASEVERVRIVYEYTQTSEFDDGVLERSKTKYTTETCIEDVYNDAEPFASAILGFEIVKSGSKINLKLEFPGAQDKTYEYEKIISVPQL